MKNRKSLLDALVNALIDEWGYDEVATALAESARQSEGKCERALARRGRQAARAPKPSATEQVERALPSGEQKDALLQLAHRYDLKHFLPSTADVREFLIMTGERPTSIKDRKDAFRILLRGLRELPLARLQHLASTELHSGPSQLGPLSDAISAAGERLPRHQRSDWEESDRYSLPEDQPKRASRI